MPIGSYASDYNQGQILKGLVEGEIPITLPADALGPGSVERSLIAELLDRTVSVKRFGAKGDGSTDDRAAFQTCFDYIRDELGGGTAYVPWTSAYYRLEDYPVICRPGVSIVGDPRRPKIKQMESSGFAEQAVFVPGNFHAAYTQDLTYYGLNTPAAGAVDLTLTTAGHAANFTAGQQVLIRSTAGRTATYFFPLYMWNNVVESINGAVLTLRYPVDVATAMEVAPLGSVLGRDSIPLFFWSDAVMRDLTIESNASWCADTATLNCIFQDLTVKADQIIYGNTFQRTKFINLDGLFRKSYSEMSHGSFRCKVVNPLGSFLPSAKTAVGGFEFQENARYIDVDGGQVDFGSFAVANPLVTMRNASRINISKTKIMVGASYGGSLIYMGGTINANDLPCFYNTVDQVTIDAGQCARYLIIEDTGGNGQVGHHSVTNCDFRGTATASDSIRINSCTVKNTFDGLKAYDGAAQLLSCTNQHFENYYFEDGWSAETGNTETSFQNNHIGRGSSAKHLVKKKLFKSQSSSVGGVVGTTVTDLFNAAVGTNMIKKDFITFRLSGRGEGTNGTKSIHCFFRNNTDSSDFDIFTHSFIAAFAGSTIGKFIIEGWIYWNDQVTFYVEVTEVTGSVKTVYSGYSTMPTAAKDLTFKIQYYGATATEGVTFHCAKVDYENVFYGR